MRTYNRSAVEFDCIDMFVQGSPVRGTGVHRAVRKQPTECSLASDEHIGDVLVFAKQRKMQQDLEWFGVCGEHDELGLAAVQRLGRLIRPFFELFVVGCLLDQVENGYRELCRCERVGFGVDVGLGLRAGRNRWEEGQSEPQMSLENNTRR